jgi:hypothetical protein
MVLLLDDELNAEHAEIAEIYRKIIPVDLADYTGTARHRKASRTQ